MAAVHLQKVKKTLYCLICGRDDFYHREEKVRVIQQNEIGFRMDEEEEYIERVICRECGWTTTFENKYDVDIDGYLIRYEE